MFQKKPWTVMVYLAADNNLANFGIDSLKQMKVGPKDRDRSKINIVAEFDTGPMNPRKRYVFDGGSALGPIQENQDTDLVSVDAGDPNNLTEFIKWAANRCPAEHYFLSIWGHGGGVDDDFPRAPDFTFVPRHSLLNMTKGVFDVPQKGAFDIPQKGAFDIPQKGAFDIPQKTALDGILKDLHTKVSGAIKEALGKALETGVMRALQDQVIKALQRGGLPDEQIKLLASYRDRIVNVLKEHLDQSFECGGICVFQDRLRDVVREAVIEALPTRILMMLIQKVLDVLKNNKGADLENHVRNILQSGIILALEKSFVDILKNQILDAFKADPVPETKSLAFVDHPASYLTNLGLKNALEDAVKAVGRLDIVGMDACNMNMVEIGYQLNGCADFLVASQDDVPDASWPYDRILARLAANPNILPEELAVQITDTYCNAYSEYMKQSVTLSVLDLRASSRIISPMHNLTKALRCALANVNGQTVINAARKQARSFGQDQFVDLINFCQFLTSGDSTLARSVNQFITDFERTEFVAHNQTMITQDGNGTTRTDPTCTGTSIYLPEFNRLRSDHQKRLGKLYNEELDFAKLTGWGQFVSEFLEQQEKESAVAAAIFEAPEGDEPDQHKEQQQPGYEPVQTQSTPVEAATKHSHSHNGDARYEGGQPIP